MVSMQSINDSFIRKVQLAEKLVPKLLKMFYQEAFHAICPPNKRVQRTCARRAKIISLAPARCLCQMIGLARYAHAANANRSQPLGDQQRALAPSPLRTAHG